jgi:hypothetical protein
MMGKVKKIIYSSLIMTDMDTVMEKPSKTRLTKEEREQLKRQRQLERAEREEERRAKREAKRIERQQKVNDNESY